MMQHYVTLFAGALLVAAALATPALSAQSTVGPVMAIQAEDELDIPAGSRLPQDRLDETEEKVRDYKAKMNERALKGLQGLPQSQNQTTDPNGQQ